MKFIISEHIYIYGFTHQRLCCMFVLGYTMLYWCRFSSTIPIVYLLFGLVCYGSVFLSFRCDEDCVKLTMRDCISDWNSTQTLGSSSSTAGTSVLCTSGLCQPHYTTVDALAITIKDMLVNVGTMTAHHNL